MASTWIILAASAVVVGGYLVWLNATLTSTPPEVLKLAPNRWTPEELRKTYAKVTKNPPDFTPHLPPKLDRRYIVTGGCGLVGGQIVLQLIARGQSPESIRILDVRKPQREDMLTGPVSKVDFVETNVVRADSVKAAFAKPWPSSVAKLPLTVFHTVAVIRAGERLKLFYDRCARVNVQGTEIVVGAARAAGASIFVSTSSGSVAVKPLQFFPPPWKRIPDGYFQVFDESDADRPLRDHYDYFGNYGVSKAIAERFIMDSGKEGDDFRTGNVRPCNAIYGNKYDQTLGTYLEVGNVPTWTAHCIQNFVSASHIAKAHLDYEAALVSPHWKKVTGKTFNIGDLEPLATFDDLYNALKVLSVTPFSTTTVQSLPLLLIGFAIEGWCVTLATLPFLKSLGLKEPQGDLFNLQPTLWSITTHLIASCAAAEKPPSEGGIGCKPAFTSQELMCDQVRLWNEEHLASGYVKGEKKRRDSTAAKLRASLRDGLITGLPVKV